MSAPLSFVVRLRDVVVPTAPQILAAFLLALALLTAAQSQSLLDRLGLLPAALSASGDQFQTRFDAVLRSPVAAQAALITFWAVIGLIAYLICWGVYNVLIEARNEVTLNTAYTNRGHWRGPYETLALKAAAGAGLGLVIVSIWPGISFWLALSARAVTEPSLSTAAFAIAAVAGFTLQLYAVLAFAQLTFTPWYRPEAFTEV